ncbi:MAG: trypsin-like serine protease [Pseudomonadota bacterium]
MTLRLIPIALLLPLAAAAQSTPQGLPLLPEADHRAWVAVGRLNVAGFRDRSTCTGTLVAPTIVLTAAHCVTKRDRTAYAPGNVHYVAGWLRGDHVWHSPAAAIAVHPDYASATGTIRIAADLAVVTLARAAPNDLVAPIPLATPFPSNLPHHAILGYQHTRAAMLSARFDCPVIDPRPDILVLDCPVIPGLSGSPVLSRTPQGWRVSGIVSAQMRRDGRAVALAPILDDWITDALTTRLIGTKR